MMLMAIIAKLSHRKNLKTISFVASSLIKAELRKVPIASEANSEKMQVVLTINIWFLGNQILANLFAALIMKQNPKEQKNVPKLKA
jgi:hypothetical protein